MENITAHAHKAASLCSEICLGSGCPQELGDCAANIQTAIDEALADYKRVLEQVEQALDNAKHKMWELGVSESEHCALWETRQALAAIAELKGKE